MHIPVKPVSTPLHKIFSLIGSNHHDTTVVLHTTNDEEKPLTVSLKNSPNNTLTQKFSQTSITGIIDFVNYLWNACKHEVDFTLQNISIIARQTKNAFPTLYKNEKVINFLGHILENNEELIAAYRTAIQYQPPKQIGVFLDHSDSDQPKGYLTPAPMLN